jgi:hypothetical protein
LREIMAQKDARIRFLERELAEREKEMETMKEREELPVAEAGDERLCDLERKVREFEDVMRGLGDDHVSSRAPEAGDERLRDLERKVRELEAVIKGLTEEVLDIKSIVMKLARDADERRKVTAVPAEARKPVVTLQAEPRAEAEPRPVRAVERKAPARQVERRQPAPVAEDDRDLELIMQNDGTLKPEPRRSSEYIVASVGSRAAAAKGRGKGGKPAESKLFVEQKARPVDDVIQAEEDDTVDLDR